VRWRASEPVEKERLRGLFYFTYPHCCAPFLIITTALAFGLIGIAGLWEGVNLATRLLATTVTVLGGLIIVQGVYEQRHKLRETELLALVRPKRLRKKLDIQLSAQLKTILVPAIAVGLVLILAYSLIKSEVLWKLTDWLLLEPEEEKKEEELPQPSPDSFRSRVERAWPLILMGIYVGFCLSLTYSSSLMLSRRYAKRMNQVLPHPIFLEGEKLAQIVRREAEVELGRLNPKDPNVISLMSYLQFEGQADPTTLRLSPGVDMSTIVKKYLLNNPG